MSCFALTRLVLDFQEQEAEQILAPEEFFAEEDKLRQEREKQQAEVDKVGAACTHPIMALSQLDYHSQGFTTNV